MAQASQSFRQTHSAPPSGMATWPNPGSTTNGPRFDPHLPVQLLRVYGDWAEIACANGWAAPQSQPVQMTSITIVSNAQHPDFPTGFGFGEVTVQVLDANRNVVFTETVSLGGTPDPMVVVTPNTRGVFVELTFRGHEAPDCGGFAELIVEATA